MTVNLDLKFAILDRGRNEGDLTQRRRGAKPQRDSCWTGSDRRLPSTGQTVRPGSRPCDFVPSRLCVEIDGAGQLDAVKPVRSKSCPRNPLMVNAVKPASSQVKPLCVLADGKWQKLTIAGVLSDFMWHSVPAIVSYCQINSRIVTYCHISQKNIFSLIVPPRSDGFVFLKLFQKMKNIWPEAIMMRLNQA